MLTELQPVTSRGAPIPGHRASKRLWQSIMRRLVQVSFSDKLTLPWQTKVMLFRLIPEYAASASEAAGLAAPTDLVVTTENDTYVLPQRLLMMLYLDYLVLGVATFEKIHDFVDYSDPRQFTSISINEVGEPSVLADSNDVSDRVGVVSRSNPFSFCWSVPEIIPHTFLFLISLHSKVQYDLSQFRKPDILITTSEPLSQEEILARRRALTDQLEDDFGSIAIYAHSGEEKPQVIEISSKPSQGLEADAIKLYDIHVKLLRSVCGISTFSEVSYPIRQFYASLKSELSRLLGSEVSLSFSTESLEFPIPELKER